jgi:hypothetical protein
MAESLTWIQGRLAGHSVPRLEMGSAWIVETRMPIGAKHRRAAPTVAAVRTVAVKSTTGHRGDRARALWLVVGKVVGGGAVLR